MSLLSLAALGLAGCVDRDAAPPVVAVEAADLVVTNADIVTMDAVGTRARALAARDGALVWVGDVVPDGMIGPDTEVVDAGGAQVLPGLHDVHNHLLEAFHPAFQCTVSGYAGLSTYAAQLAACAPPAGDGWVVAWGFDFWTAERDPSRPADVLDAVYADRPVVVMESTSHAAWVNDAALAALGFDASSPDPNGGVILRGDDGAPTGLLLDAAAELVFDVALAPGPDAHEQNVAALREGLAAAAANGITALGDGRCFWKRGYDAAWRALDDEGALTLRAVVPLWAYPEEDDDAQLAFFRGYAPREGTHLTFGQVKLYADGITWLTTGAMLEPYTGPTFAGPTGLNYFDAARLTRYVTELEREGYDLHIHAIGDRGVREALDAIAAARATNGDVGARHRITHVEWVAPDDVPRFAELGVVADIQLSGVWTQPQFLHDNDFLVGADTVDERAYRLRDLQDAGARITLSSDYDVGPMSPFVGVARAVDRGDQSLRDRSAALRAVTVDAAWVLRTEQQTGSLEAGKRADFIVVDRDVFTTPALADTVVCATWFEGHEVFRRSDCGA